MSHNPERALWQEVLLRQVDDALLGAAGVTGVEQRTQVIEEARAFLTTPSKHLEHLCLCAGIDSDGLITRMRSKIADAPDPATLATNRKASRSSVTKRTAKPKPKLIKHADRQLTLKGETLTMQQWADRTGLTVAQIAARLRDHWTVERALTQPVGKRNRGWGATGVVSDFAGSEGTGGGRSAQDSPKISFSELEAS